MSTILTWIVSFLTSKWTPIGMTLAALVIVYENVLSIMVQVRWVIAKMDGMSQPSTGTHAVSGSVFGLVNFVAPLDLGIALFVLWLPVFVLAASIRLTKSFIPTIAS